MLSAKRIGYEQNPGTVSVMVVMSVWLAVALLYTHACWLFQVLFDWPDIQIKCQ